VRVFDSTLLTVVTQCAALAVSFCVSLLVSRFLGADGKGVFSLLLYTATILFGVCNLGLGFASQYFVRREPATIRAQFSNALIFPLVLSLFVGCAFFLGFSMWEPYLQGLIANNFWPVLVMLPFILIFESCCQLLVARDCFGQRSFAVLVQSGTVLIVTVAFLLAGVSAIMVSLSYAAGWLIGGVLAFWFVAREVGSPVHPSLSLLRTTLQYSLWIYVANIIKEFSLKVDFLYLYSSRSIGEAGVYSVAAALTSGMTAIMLAIQTVFYPRTSANTDQGANQTTPVYYRQMWIAMAVAGGVMALSSRPLLAMFGANFVQGAGPMLILIAGTAVKGANSILFTHILGRGKSYVMVLVTISTLLTTTLLNSWLVGGYGMMGAATATLGAFVIENLILMTLYRYLTGGAVTPLYTFSLEDIRLLYRAGVSFSGRLFNQLNNPSGKL